jgi:hypothetical protein
MAVSVTEPSGFGQAARSGSTNASRWFELGFVVEGEDSMSARKNSTGARAAANLIHGYGNLAALEEAPPLVIASGKGVRVFDEDGRSYIEGIAGMWCASFGFSEEAIVEAAIGQLRRMPYYHTLFDKTTTQAGELAEKVPSLRLLSPVSLDGLLFSPFCLETAHSDRPGGGKGWWVALGTEVRGLELVDELICGVLGIAPFGP